MNKLLRLLFIYFSFLCFFIASFVQSKIKLGSFSDLTLNQISCLWSFIMFLTMASPRPAPPFSLLLDLSDL